MRPQTSNTPARPHVVILGGGFAGLQAARALARDPVDVTVIDRRNHHLFQPLLYQVATAALNPGDIATPIRSVLRDQRNARTLLAEATHIDLGARVVQLHDGAIGYDYLVVATGATHSYLGQDQWAAVAPGLKTVEDALDMRRRILLAFEDAERAEDVQTRSALLTFVVVGAGPTGVELAGALAEIGRFTLARDFRSFDPRGLRVVLVEGGNRLLTAMSETLSAAAERQLTDLGVEVRKSAKVTDIDEHGVTFADGSRLASRTVLWAAGVQASPLGVCLSAPTDRAGRVHVEPDLSLAGHPEAFVAGDLMHAPAGEGIVPGVAPAAIQSGQHVALAIRARMAGRPTAPFVYRDKGSLATIGRAAAVGSLAGFEVRGFLAWWLWWIVHIAYLIGFRNRLSVMIGWAWQYFAFRRGARLITGRALRRSPSLPPGRPSQS